MVGQAKARRAVGVIYRMINLYMHKTISISLLIKYFIDCDVWLASLRGSWLASLQYTVLDIVWNAIVDCQVLVDSKVEFSCNMLRDKAEIWLGVHSIIVSFLSFCPDIKVRIKYSTKGLTKTIILVGWTVPWNVVVGESVVLED